LAVFPFLVAAAAAAAAAASCADSCSVFTLATADKGKELSKNYFKTTVNHEYKKNLQISA